MPEPVEEVVAQSTLHARLTEIIEEIWNGAVDSDGRVGPSLEAALDWHWRLWEGTKHAGILRDNPRLKPARKTAVGKRLAEACRRLKRQLKTPYDPSVEMHLIARALAEFIVTIRQLQPFTNGGGLVETPLVHACCKFAGCAPPKDIRDERWEAAVARSLDTELPPDVRRAALTNLLIRRIRDANAQRGIA